jgi:hypothetical protein
MTHKYTAQAEFDRALEQAMQALQKPQSNEPEARLVYRMEIRGK